MTSSSSTSSMSSSDKSYTSDDERNVNHVPNGRNLQMGGKEMTEGPGNPFKHLRNGYQAKEADDGVGEKNPEAAGFSSDDVSSIDDLQKDDKSEKKMNMMKKVVDFSKNIKHQMLSSTSSSSLSSVGSFFTSDEEKDDGEKNEGSNQTMETNKQLHGEPARSQEETKIKDESAPPSAEANVPILQSYSQEMSASAPPNNDVNVKIEKTERRDKKTSSSSSEVNVKNNVQLLTNDNFDATKEIPTNEVKEERARIIPPRPKTAKPPRHNRSAREASESEQSQQTSGSSASFTTSSHSSLEKDNDVKHRNSLEDLEQRTRERFLHRCLDEHLSSQLSRHRARFDLSAPPTGQRRGAKKTPSSVRRKQRSETSGRQDPEVILPAFSPRVREEDVRRNIRVLIAELARHESLKSLMASSPLIAYPNRTQSKNYPGKRNIKRGNRRSDFESSSSNSSSSANPNKQKVFVDLTESTSSSSDNSIEKDEGLQQKSILRRSKQGKSHQKHVRMMEEKEKKRFYSKARKRKVRGEEVRAHLTALLSSIGPADYVMTDTYGQLHHVTLRHTPINPKHPSYRVPTQAKRRPRKKKNKKNFSECQEKVDKAEKENKAAEEKESSKQRPATAKATSRNSDNNQVPVGERVTPRIRPGTGPIKCNWKPEDKPNIPELKFSDHQLKNSSNPAVLEWLTRKNALERANRIHKFREHRTKRDRLMQEQNEREDKQVNALVEYEKWKNKKRRETLLRRRREAIPANTSTSEVMSSTMNRNKTVADPAKVQDSSITTFADLRSSSISPHPPIEMPPSSLVVGGARRRPKSAPTKVSFGATGTKRDVHPHSKLVPVRIDFETRDVTVISPNEASDVRNRTGNEPRVGGTKSSFMNTLMEEEQALPPSMFDVSRQRSNEGSNSNSPTPDKKGADSSSASTLGRDHYDNWVRSKGLSSPYQVKLNKKKKTKKTPNAPHDPLTNEMVSDLAKRRIKKILDQKKRVDSGLPRNQKPASDKMADKPSNEASKWKLKEEMTVDLKLDNVPKKRRPKPEANSRPTFSYNKKSKSKSVFHERNPVLKQALNT